MTESNFEAERQAMVTEQLKARGITDERVLAVMATVPRETFVPADNRKHAYFDGALPIEMQQTISQPYIVAWMTQLLALQGHEKVLEIGVGSGYQTAVLCQLAEEIVGVERIPELAQVATERLSQLGYDNAAINVSDGSVGFSEQAPYDAILVAAAAPAIPESLIAQLAVGGRLVLPVGTGEQQEMQRVTRRGEAIHIERLTNVRFVPLIGAEGFLE